MTLQQADYPDWLRVESTVVPTPFIDDSAYNLASGTVRGGFNVGIWPSLQFAWLPTGLDQRLNITWYSDSTLTRALGTYLHDVKAGLQAAMIVRNRGAFCTVRLDTSSGAGATGSLWVAGSTQAQRGNVAQQNGVLCDNNSFVLAAGASTTLQPLFGYTGPAQWSVRTAIKLWGSTIIATNFQGVVRRVAEFRNANVAHDELVYLPPSIISVQVQNLSRVSGTFACELYPVIEG